MRVNKYIWLWLWMIGILTGCIESFTPDITEHEQMMVITGMICDQEGYQSVEISRSAPFDEPEPDPVTDCVVRIVDEFGNTLSMPEESPGTYTAYFDNSFLHPGTQYKLEVTTQDGATYYSEYEKFMTSPPIDSIYYEIKSFGQTDPNAEPIDGIQIYLDTDASDNESYGFMWKLSEAWEYHAMYPILCYYYDSMLYFYDDPDLGFDAYMHYYCWMENNVKNIFTYGVSEATTRKVRKAPLNFISNQSVRLKYDYSMLVKQYTLSKSAFAYWEKLQEQSNESGGLYETQPVRIIGNIYNANDPEEIVLGYFGVSGVSEKRIFINEAFPFRITDPYNVRNNCFAWELESLMEYLLEQYTDTDTAWLFNEGPESPVLMMNQKCLDCRLRGGRGSKPDYWR